MTNENYDYIIVGAGSAGCVLANRLTASGEHSVLLLEAGAKDNNPLVSMPLGWAQLFYHKSLDWGYYSQPEPEMDGYQMYSPRGKMLGGSSSTNGMIYIRGQAQDYDDLAALGNRDWAYDNVLPYFKKSENCSINDVDTKFHGQDGELTTSPLRFTLPLTKTYIAAAVEAGYKANNDFNGADQEGVGYYHVTQKDGKRASTAAAFLKPVKKRENLTIRTHALAKRIEFDGKKATGICYLNKKGQEITVTAEKEIILSLGSFNTPQLLELSGVGQQQILDQHGIKPVQILEGVGENLQEHLSVKVVQRVKDENPTINSEAAPLKIIKHVFNYMLNKKGLMTLPAADVGVFCKGEGDDRPSYQIHFSPGGGELTPEGQVDPEFPSVTSTCCVVRPKSRGFVHIQSADVKQAPKIQFNFMQHEDDKRRMVEAVAIQRKIYASKSFAPYRLEELAPGIEAQSDADILKYVNVGSHSVYHPVGTCKMGNDEKAVVDDRLHVHGLKNLRIADASILPNLISGNTNAATIMIAERCADFIINGE
ncbi:MAG: GMC family oxidoreductase N-terminal domain-containing protein [Pseudomonadales bacterium]|nr:GMC family oxidoreductase N-terminal domain-containing protein [Pseudomonadales bacterium]